MAQSKADQHKAQHESSGSIRHALRGMLRRSDMSVVLATSIL